MISSVQKCHKKLLHSLWKNNSAYKQWFRYEKHAVKWTPSVHEIRCVSHCWPLHNTSTNKHYASLLIGFHSNSKVKNYGQKLYFSTSFKLYNSQGDKNKNDDDNQMSTLLTKAFFWVVSAYVFVTVLSMIFPNSNDPETVRYVSWNEFVHQMLAKGEVEEIVVHPDAETVTIILHEGAVIKGKKADIRTYSMNVGNIGRFEEKLRDAEKNLGVTPGNGVPVVYERISDTAGRLIVSLVIAGVVLMLLRRFSSMKLPNLDNITQFSKAKFTMIDPLTGGGKGVKFSDVAGLKEAKQEVIEFVDYLKRPEKYKELGAKVPRGALLLGPPGCGKTLLAKAVATEANVPFLAMNGSEFIEMIGGLGAARVRDLFKEARKRAPCIIYIDEIDAIGKRRNAGTGGSMDNTTGEGEQTLNQLLVEMDGMITKEGVIMLASTNRADVLDMALMRPGRFDRHILIDYPNFVEREEIFRHHLKSIVLENEPKTYSPRLAKLTPGFSGADIANICNEAALHAARVAKKRVEASDLEYAIERVVAGVEKKTQVMNIQEKKVVAYHESGHALLGWLLEHTDVLLKVTILPRTNQALGFAQYAPSDQKLFSKEQLFERMVMALGGRAAEALTFNRITTGAANDLEKVTKMAYAQVRVHGLNDKVGHISFAEEDHQPGRRRPYSKKLANLIDYESRALIARAYKMAEKTLTENRDLLIKMAEALLVKETLNYDDVVELLGPPRFPNKHMVDPLEFESQLQQDSGRPPSLPGTKEKPLDLAQYSVIK